MDRALQQIGFQNTVWLDARVQGGMSQLQLVSWHGTLGFEAIGNGGIMATVDFA